MGIVNLKVICRSGLAAVFSAALTASGAMAGDAAGNSGHQGLDLRRRLNQGQPADTVVTDAGDGLEVPTEPKVNVPTDDKQKTGMDLVKNVYKDDIRNAGSSEEKSALARKLLQVGIDSKGDSSDRYAAFILARDLAAAAGDCAATSKAVDLIDGCFKVDAVALRWESLRLCSRSVKDDQSRELVTHLGSLVDKAIESDQYSIADEARDLGFTTARKNADISSAAEFNVRGKELAVIEKAYKDISLDMEILKADPKDATANYNVGRFRCFIKGDWKGGLGLLEAGSDATLKAIAKTEIDNPGPIADEMKLADRWWDVAEKEENPAKRQIQKHAMEWYMLVYDSLDGLGKLKVDGRIKKFASSGLKDTRSVNVLDQMKTPDATIEDGFLTLRMGQTVSTTTRYRPPVAFKIVAQTQDQIRLGYAANQIIFNWEGDPTQLRVDGGPANGQHKAGAGSIPTNQWVTFDIIVLSKSITIQVNGEQRYHVEADFSQVNDPLSIIATNASLIKIKSAQMSKP